MSTVNFFPYGQADSSVHFEVDGSGSTDVTQIIQNVLISLYPSTSPPFDTVLGKLRIGKGTYLISGLVLNWPIDIEGEGWATIFKLKNGANKYAISFNPQVAFRFTGARFANFKIDCNSANQIGASGGIDGKGACYCEFSHLWIEQPYQYGISLHDDNLGGFGHHNFVHHNWFHKGDSSPGSGGASDAGVGLRTHNSDENRIEHNIFEQCGTPSGTFNSAAYFDDGGLQTLIGNVFVADPNVNGIEQCKLASTRYQVIGNIFDGGTNAQLEFSGGSDEGSILSNFFYAPINTSPCLLLSAGSNYVIDANLFESSGTNNATDSGIKNSTGNPIMAGLSNRFVTKGTWNTAPTVNANMQYYGNGVPASTLGINGDTYTRLDTPGTANQRYYVKAAGAWSGIL